MFTEVVGMTQVQVRLSGTEVETLDQWVEEGRFKSRSDAIRSVLQNYKEREKTREFYTMLEGRSDEADNPDNLTPLEEV